MKIVMTPFKLAMVLFRVKKDDYPLFRILASGKHFYNWQWKLLDRIYGHKEEVR